MWMKTVGSVITVTSDSPPLAVTEAPADEEEMWGPGDTGYMGWLEL